MTESREPINCRNYPFCDHLKSVLEEIPGDLLVTKTVVLKREARSICAKCADFEPRPYRP
jgi:hypothetical protein